MQGENEVAIYGDVPQPASIESVLGHLLREIAVVRQELAALKEGLVARQLPAQVDAAFPARALRFSRMDYTDRDPAKAMELLRRNG